MTNKKLMLVPAALIFVLFASGLTYGLWFQTLYVEGVVDTGILDWCWYFATIEDDQAGEFDWNILPGFVGAPYRTDKDVGNGSVAITDCHTIQVTLRNTYPCYWTEVAVYANNTGTIPLHFEWLLIKDNNGVVIANVSGYQPGKPTAVLDLTGDSLPDIEIWFGDSRMIGTQVHPNETLDEVSFWLHVLQTSPENAILQFSLEFFGVQWNESIHPFQQPS